MSSDSRLVVKGAVEGRLGCLSDPRLRRLMLDSLFRYMGSANSFILKLLLLLSITKRILGGYFVFSRLTLWRVVSILLWQSVLSWEVLFYSGRGYGCFVFYTFGLRISNLEIWVGWDWGIGGNRTIRCLILIFTISDSWGLSKGGGVSVMGCYGVNGGCLHRWGKWGVLINGVLWGKWGCLS